MDSPPRGSPKREPQPQRAPRPYTPPLAREAADDAEDVEYAAAPADAGGGGGLRGRDVLVEDQDEDDRDVASAAAAAPMPLLLQQQQQTLPSRLSSSSSSSPQPKPQASRAQMSTSSPSPSPSPAPSGTTARMPDRERPRFGSLQQPPPPPSLPASPSTPLSPALPLPHQDVPPLALRPGGGREDSTRLGHGQEESDARDRPDVVVPSAWEDRDAGNLPWDDRNEGAVPAPRFRADRETEQYHHRTGGDWDKPWTGRLGAAVGDRAPAPSISPAAASAIGPAAAAGSPMTPSAGRDSSGPDDPFAAPYPVAHQQGRGVPADADVGKTDDYPYDKHRGINVGLDEHLLGAGGVSGGISAVGDTGADEQELYHSVASEPYPDSAAAAGDKDSSTEDDEYDDFRSTEVPSTADFRAGSPVDSRMRVSDSYRRRSTNTVSSLPPWNVFSRLQRQLEAMNTALILKCDTPDGAEREIMCVAKFALATRVPDTLADRRDSLAKSAALKSLVAVIRRYRTSPRVATVGCSALSALAAGDDRLQHALGAAGAIQAVLDCIEVNVAEDERVIEAGLRSLAALLWNPDNRAIMREQRGIDLVASTMGQYAHYPGIQTEGCTLLANCAFSSEENKRIITDNFGIDLIVTAMKQFPADQDLQCRACLALRNLTFGMPEVVSRCCLQGGLSAVLGAMAHHPDSVLVVEQAAVALGNMILSLNSARNVQHLIANPGYIDILLGTLRRHYESDPIQCNILSVMEAVAKESPASVEILANAGAVESVVATMRIGITRPSVLHRGAAMLHAMVVTPDQRPNVEKCLLSAGGIDALLELLYISVTAPPPRA